MPPVMDRVKGSCLQGAGRDGQREDIGFLGQRISVCDTTVVNMSLRVLSKLTELTPPEGIPTANCEARENDMFLWLTDCHRCVTGGDSDWEAVSKWGERMWFPLISVALNLQLLKRTCV